MEKDERDVVIEILQTFQIGELPDDDLALLLSYATSQEKLSRSELDSFVIGMTRAKAIELGNELIRQARLPPSGKLPAVRQ
jgi:hypothetical protein